MINHLELDAPVVADVNATKELFQRPQRAPDHAAENRALAILSCAMAEQPGTVLQKLSELVLELCAADSAGVSVLESEGANELFRWRATAGAFAKHLNGVMPRDASPCGQVIALTQVMLFADAERVFPAMRGLDPHCHEILLVPWTVNGEAVGTIWAVGHRAQKKFDTEDVRILQSLANFASIAHQMVVSIEQATKGTRELEQRVAARTNLLSETNEKLQREIARRCQVEAALRDTQAQLATDLGGMRRLYELHARLVSETDLVAALDEILAVACDFTDTDRGCVQLISSDGKRLEIVAHRGYGPTSPFIEKFRVEGFAQGCDAARVERRRLVIDDTANFPGLLGTAEGVAVFADGIGASQSTPMISRQGETVGVLSTQFRRPHRPSENELRLVDVLAWTAANFVERHHAETAIRHSEHRQAFLLKLSDAVRPLTDPIAIQSVVSRMLGEHLAANRVFLAEFNAGEVIVQRDYVDGVPSMAGRYPMDAFGADYMAEYEKGNAFVVDDLDSDPRMTENDRATYARAKIAAQIGVGLIRNGRVVGAFGVHHKTPRTWTASEIGLVQEVAEHARSAVERARAEEALKEADLRKDEFLATLAHELRNPLAPISNAVQMLRMPLSDDKAHQLVAMIGRQVHQIVKLVDDLLEISRISRGKIKLDKQPVELKAVVRTAVESSRPLIDDSRHAFSVSLPDQPVIMDADSVRLTQIITNLLNNAAKYTDIGGTIDLTARVDGGDVVISVCDNGIGIPQAQLPHVFNMFMQLHRDGGRSQGGLGIGLTMVRDLVEMHGGTVEAKSEGPGQGSEFIVRLPVMQGGASSATDVDSANCHRSLLSGHRILVVDDNRDAADSLAMLLEANGAEVHTAYGGDSAIDMLETLRPHTLLLDLGMPGKDGYEVARQIRNDRRFDAIRIVALTGWGQETDRDRTRNCGFDVHFTKPLDFSALERWITQ